MVRKLIEWAVDNPLVVLLMAVALAVVGAGAFFAGGSASALGAFAAFGDVAAAGIGAEPLGRHWRRSKRLAPAAAPRVLPVSSRVLGTGSLVATLLGDPLRSFLLLDAPSITPA